MLFQSHIYPDVKSTQELVVFRYEQERVLVPLPKTYEDAQNCVKDIFNIQGDVAFETADLHGSIGAPVRIHNAAWQGISSVLHSVSVVKPTNGPEHSLPVIVGVAASPPPRISAQKRANISLNAGPSRLATVAAKSPASASVKKAFSKPPSPRTNAATGGSQPAVAIVSPRVPTVKAPKPKPKRAPSPPPAAVVKTPEPSDDEEEQETRILSPTKKRVQRPRVLSDYGVDEPEISDEPAEEQAESEHGEAEEDELDDTEYASAAAPPAKQAPPPSSSKGRAPAKFKPASSAKSTKVSTAELDDMHSELRQSPRVKIEKGQVAQTSQSQSEEVTTSQTQGQSDESFLVMINYEKSPDGPSLFKTRGRHMVSKVLMQACRTFDIEQYYDRARLVLLVDDGDEVYRSECRRNVTMAEAGAEADARFVVEIDE
ncbi:hypothetical protein BN946_scf184791.g28 [Trametes cinnabarina]|uniref:Uncharacterized protein n=1 Tax=Pycnoporus cinnabarinus TaxID=5643 RepID=A0A060SAL6_PYCCI|nr:hypothetical protein BN946_scf184791.g28 [Trametes cinnabarina]